MSDMDFNSNDEYLKAFPPNFGAKLEGCNMLSQLTVSDFHAPKVLPENQQDNIEETYMKQMPEPACLSEELECVEVQEPIQVHAPVYSAENKGDEMLKAHELLTLCKEDLAPARDQSNSAQPEIIERMLQVEDMTPVMEVQRDNEMILGESDGEPRELSVESTLSLQAMETRVFDGETLSDTQVERPLSAIEIMHETRVHSAILAEDASTIGVIKDSILALDNVDHYEAEKSVLEEATEVATMKEETSVGLPPLREFVEGTQIFVEQKRPIADIGTVEGNTMDTEPLQDVQNGQPVGALGQIEFLEDTMATLIEISEDADAIDRIECKEPVTLQMIKTTTVRATYETQTSKNELTEQTQIEPEVLETEDAATMVLEITEKTSTKAKAICPYEREEAKEPLSARNGVPSASNSTTGLEDLGTCSDADVDKIVDGIMNDIADIEADMEVKNEEVENEADMESNTQHQKFEICGQSIGMESTAIRQDYIQSMGSHV